ncbi:MAG: hypothetical protein K6C94_02330 [Candidatus Gastranaerophilales bacterium]|nr:hypothetical protein [Candidatus Gastranaerophilales bacterium]
MIQIWKRHKSQNGDKTETAEDYTLVSVQDTIENAQYFCEKNRLEDVEFVKVLD